MTPHKLLIFLGCAVLLMVAVAWHHVIYTIDDNDIIKILREDIEELRNRQYYLVILDYKGKVIYEQVSLNGVTEFHKPILVKSFEIR